MDNMVSRAWNLNDLDIILHKLIIADPFAVIYPGYFDSVLFCGYIRENIPNEENSDIKAIILEYFSSSYMFKIPENELEEKLNNLTTQTGTTILTHQQIDSYLSMNASFEVINNAQYGNAIRFRLAIPQNTLQNDQQLLIYAILCLNHSDSKLSTPYYPYYKKFTAKFDAQTRSLRADIYLNRWNEKIPSILEFHFSNKILDVADIPKICPSPIRLYDKAEYIWKIDSKLLGLFQKAAVNETFYSKNFGEHTNWCLSFTPCNRDSNCIARVELMKLPLGIQSISADVEVETSNNGGWNRTVRLDHDNYTHGRRVMTNAELYRLTKLRIEVEITISAIYVNNGQGTAVAEPACNWSKYNVIPVKRVVEFI